MITHVWVAEEAGGYDPGTFYGVYATAAAGIEAVDKAYLSAHSARSPSPAGYKAPFIPLAWTPFKDEDEEYWEAAGGLYVTRYEIEGLENTE